MSTRSAIIRKTDEGYEGIYCHYDGYIEGVGVDLLYEYQSDEEVAALIKLGELRSLGKSVGETEAYHRDCGEEYTAPVKGKTILAVANEIGHDDYIYVYENGEWRVNGESLEKKVDECA